MVSENPKNQGAAKEGFESAEALAAKNFERWNNALLTKDAKVVASLYSANNTFLPTVNGKFRSGLDEAEEYFKHFVEKHPNGTITESAVQMLGPSSYLHSGHYDFEVGPQDKRETVNARFSFVWQLEDGEWKIAHHHSSKNPEA